jgi:G:T-mismatch repair DNA endonuclease (very short patch repair protein)
MSKITALGYRFLTLWECGLKDQSALESRLKAFLTH